MANPKSKSRRPKSTRRKRPAPQKIQPLLRTCFSHAQLLLRFHKLLPAALLIGWLALAPKGFYLRAFTPQITLWYFLFQRLSHNHCLSHVVQDARDGGADRLSPKSKRLSRQLSSESTASYSDARQRLPLEILHRCLRHIAKRVDSAFQTKLWLGHKVALTDGSTLRMRPLGDIAAHFPP